MCIQQASQAAYQRAVFLPCPVFPLGAPTCLLPHSEGGPCQYETALLEEYKPALHLVLGKIQHFVLFVLKKNGSIQNACITSNLIFGAYAAQDQPDVTVIKKSSFLPVREQIAPIYILQHPLPL